MAKLHLDEELVKKLAGILNEADLTEIEYEEGGARVRVARHIQATLMAPPAAAHTAPAAPTAPADEPGAPAVPKENLVTAPMVGTAYLAPEPGSKPFVAVGERVAAGQVLAIIEAMKVMNQIPAAKAGVVEAVLVADGQPVEYGEPLFVIS